MRPNTKQPWMPETSYEYGVPDDERFERFSPKDWEAEAALNRRNRNVLVLSDGVTRTDWGGVVKVKRPPLMNGRRWAFLEKW